jgi:hypothetical protein
MSISFTPAERAVFAALANVLIPAGEGFPSASEALVADEGLDQVLAVRPDLAAGLKTILERAAGRVPAEVVAELQANDPQSFGILAEIVPGAYFMNAKVRAAIGYDGQTPRPIDPKPDHLQDGLLQSVIDRGPIYRGTPRAGAKPQPEQTG